MVLRLTKSGYYRPHFQRLRAKSRFHPEDLSLLISPFKESFSSFCFLYVDSGSGHDDFTKFCVSAFGCKETEVAAIAGESVQLLPLKLPESWTEITWEVTLDSAETYGIVTFHKGEPPDHGSTPHFINRVTFHPDNLSLQIDPVKKSDSGLYSLQTETGGGRIDITKFRVSVFNRVRQPNLTVLSAHPELGQCSVTLFCSVPGADRVTYSWSRGTSWIPSDRDQQLPGNRSLLHVVINADSSDVFYRCNASNRASWAADAADVNPLCNSPATGPLLSYCTVKGILLLRALGAMVTMTAATHILTRDGPGPDEKGEGRSQAAAVTGLRGLR
ncbi:natural killer cell receptor 2B4-like [Chelonoidis abingdonii]|uniref:natural killer cell receptor 2B4-like n=1 Tax=Chelonoidis abingdonii TaxID=106734 RepID=UPI0013F19516|nr:natural killer cell receptor 2B4-like [Chelonoidis abingdonii]